MQIIHKETDLAGKYRVWVEIAKNELAMFKFSKQPTQEMVDDALANLVKVQENSEQRELDLVNEQILSLTKRKETLEKEILESEL